jgi:hypothetical protein
MQKINQNNLEKKGKSLTLKLAGEYLKIKYELIEILNFLRVPTFILNHEEKVIT